MEDSAIISLFFSRDDRAITEAHTKYGSYCQRIANSVLDDDFESEECVNDTLLRIWNAIPPEKPTCFKAFIAKITRSLAIDKARVSNRVKRSADIIGSVEELSVCQFFFLIFITSQVPTPPTSAADANVII